MKTVRALESIILRSTKAPIPRPLAVPSGPTCSRWYSCSCCSRATSPTFFSSRRVASEDRHVEEEAFALARPPSRSPPTLPLPPRLPYSPGSRPFQRHMDVLALSLLSSSPGDSWKIYLSLHPSLRRYIPDKIYQDLIRHELNEDQPKQRWVRSSSLILFGKKCGISLASLGIQILQDALAAGLTYTRMKKDRTEEYDGLLDELMESVNVPKLPLQLRMAWLSMHFSTMRMKLGLGKGNQPTMDAALRAIKHIVDKGGGQGLEEMIGAMLVETSPTPLPSLDLIAYCWSRDVRISISTLVNIITQATGSQSEDRGFQQQKAEQLLEEVDKIPGSEIYINRARATLSERLRNPRVKLDHALDLATPAAIRHAVAVLRESPSDEGIKKAMETCEEALKSNLECSHLISELAIKSDHPALQARKLPFLTAVLQSKPPLRSSTLQILLKAACANVDSNSFPLAKAFYKLSRGADPPFKWSHQSFKAWRNLFQHALSVKQLHFASRLYADLAADEIPLRRTDALTLIRTLGGSDDDSRQILLERHVKDYLWQDYGTLDAFVTALCEGMRGNAKDATLAFHLSKRILKSRPLPPRAAAFILNKLAADQQVKACQDVLSSTVPTADIYHGAIATILETSQDSAIGLTHAIQLYKDMVSQRVLPKSSTISQLLRGLVRSDQLTLALGLFQHAIEYRIVLHSASVGALMMSLAKANRLEDAEEVEKTWRSLKPKADTGIVTARVLMDTMRGKEVDFKDLASRGWKPTPAFRETLRRYKHVPALPEQSTSRVSRPLIQESGEETGGLDMDQLMDTRRARMA